MTEKGKSADNLAHVIYTKLHNQDSMLFFTHPLIINWEKKWKKYHTENSSQIQSKNSMRQNRHP